MRPRILYVPIFAAFEARQFAQLTSDWADVESFDSPGTGSRSAEDPGGFEQVAAAGAQRLDELGWESCVVVCDSHGQAAGAELPARDPRVKGAGMGHAALRYDPVGPRPTLSPAVHSAARQLLETDYRSFGHAVTQLTQGALDDEWVGAFLADVPRETARARMAELTSGVELASRLAGEDLDLVLARHVGCMMWTSEGFDEAAATLPDATTVDCETVPVADPAFHSALRELCGRVFG